MDTRTIRKTLELSFGLESRLIISLVVVQEFLARFAVRTRGRRAEI
jgi:hypothetical protein